MSSRFAVVGRSRFASCAVAVVMAGARGLAAGAEGEPAPSSAQARPTGRLAGRVVCDGCPRAPIHVVAYPTVDRYGWPWWDAYGILSTLHDARALGAMRPAPVAEVVLEAPGAFQLTVPADVPVHVFALLDADRSGLATGPTAPDRIARFPRNPVTAVAPGAATATATAAAAGAASGPGPLDLVLYPLVWSPSFDAERYHVPAAAPRGIRFRDATRESGITFRHCQGGDPGQLPVVTGSGALLEDLDGDGDLDLIAVQGLGVCPGAPRTTVLYRNDGRGRFTDATEGSGIGLEAAGMGIVAADYDHDGDVDVYLTTLTGGHLFRNDGALHFSDVTAKAGLVDGGAWTAGASFGDVDGDGLLDLFVATYVDFAGGRPPFTPDAEIPSFAPGMLSSPFAFPAVPDRLYRNRGDGTFEDVPDALGARDPGGKGMAAVLLDLDHDGDLDLYVTNDCTKDRVFENRGGRLTDVATAARVDDVQSGMGIAAGDIDGDGLPDLFSPHWMNEPVVLYRNRSQPGALRFEDVTVSAGLAGSGNGLTGWAAELVDVDRDGDLNLVVSNGHTHPHGKGVLEAQPLQLFLNDGRGRFSDASAALAAAVPEPQVWRGAALGDVDGDGDVDAYLVAWNGPGRLLLNESEHGHGITVLLVRKNGERGAVGARVVVRAGPRTIERAVVTGTSYFSHSSLAVEVGLGRATKIDALEVVWPGPGGRRERFPAPRVDGVVTLVEGQGSRAASR